MNDTLQEYFEALERLKSNNPINVLKNSKINNDSVALEAGRKRGSIKKSREIFAELMEGNSVKLGSLGTLTPVFNAKAVSTLEEANEKTITRKFLRFTASEKIRKAIKNIPVELDKTDQIKGLQPSSNR